MGVVTLLLTLWLCNPNPFADDPAQGAGQQSSFLTPMGETGTPWALGVWEEPVNLE